MVIIQPELHPPVASFIHRTSRKSLRDICAWKIPKTEPLPCYHGLPQLQIYRTSTVGSDFFLSNRWFERNFEDQVSWGITEPVAGIANVLQQFFLRKLAALKKEDMSEDMKEEIMGSILFIAWHDIKLHYTTSHMIHHGSCIIHHMSYIIYHTSYLYIYIYLYHISYIIYHISYIIYIHVYITMVTMPWWWTLILILWKLLQLFKQLVFRVYPYL